ncbi:outer membrane beta-barrel protein [Kriegella sp. EG-1]|nr:outer membrane beta-barrel protein [Flavobacteriaceae bacterium EG-1]
MKKVIFLAVFLFAITAKKMNAQVIVQDKTISNKSSLGEDIRFGAKAGLNISTFLNKDFFAVKPKPGGYVGGIVEVPITDEIYAQPELLVSFQGADIGIGDLNFIYVHLPLMGKYHITDEIAAEFGPQVSFVLDDNFGFLQYSDADSNIPSYPKKVQVALNFGGGYRLDDNFYFQARFSLGLTKTIENYTFKNGVAQIGAAYFF